MHAIGFKQPGSIDREDAFSDIELPTPKAEGRDLLIEVKAVSVNPVDTKMRKGAEPSLRNQPSPDAWRVLGWDAAGVVAAVGPEVTLFQPGETVFYAGTIGRSGTNAEYHLVDERIVGHKPETTFLFHFIRFPCSNRNCMAEMTTMSKDRPSIFHSWGGVLRCERPVCKPPFRKPKN